MPLVVKRNIDEDFPKPSREIRRRFLDLTAVEHPEELGTCHANIGAAYYFLSDYRAAITHYKTAKAHGTDASMMDENVAEAKAALGKSA